METTAYNLIQALGWSMLHSIWLGAIAYMLYSIQHLLTPKRSSSGRYSLAYGLQFSVFIGFIGCFLYYYSRSKAVSLGSGLSAQDLVVYMTMPPTETWSLESTFPYLSMAYFLGFGVQLLILINSYIRLRRLKYKGLDGIPEEWQSLFGKAVQKLGIEQRVSLFLSHHITVPMTVGFFRPFVLFPIAYVNKLNLVQVEAILLHELAHIKRLDYLFNLIKVVIETTLFFNPFVWAMSKIIEREREHACDDMVMQQVESPMPYAKALVELEELRLLNNPALAMAATGKKNHLLQRIKRITNMESNYRNVKQQLIAVLASAIALLAVALIVPAQAENTESESNSTLNLAIAQVQEVPEAPAPLKLQVDTILPVKQTVIPQESTHDSVEIPEKIKLKIKELEFASKDIQDFVNSPEWKSKVASIQEQSNKIHDYFQSEDWKNRVKASTLSNEKLNSLLASKNFKDMPVKEINEFFQSKAWKDQIKAVNESAAQLGKEYFETSEWKNQIAKLSTESKQLTDFMNTPEWKNKMKQVEDNGKEIGAYFRSEEWKDKVQKANLEKTQMIINQTIKREVKEFRDRMPKDSNLVEQP